MKNENVIKMARLMVGCTDITCEDCLSQSKKLFGTNECALIEYAEVLDKAGYRKQSETAKEFAEKIVKKFGKSCSEYYPEFIEMTSVELYYLAEQFGKEE